MNMIVTPVTPDGDAGFDEFNQFIVFVPDNYGGKTGTIRYDLRGKICPLCGKHWELSNIGLNDQVYLNHTQQHVHQTCYARYRAHMQRSELINDLDKAGIWTGPDYNSFEEIPNQYDTGERGAPPWYKIRILKKPQSLEFGRRKRVFSLRFQMLSIDQQLGLTAQFNKESNNTTKGEGNSPEDGLYCYIHAWNHEEVVRYLKIWKSVLDQFE
jgi:hypothetical protein